MKAAITAVLVASFFAIAGSAADKDEFDSANPTGKPRFGIGKTHFVVWHSGNDWHVRTTSDGNSAHQFSISMNIQGGKVGTLKPVSAEKKSTKKGTPADGGTWNKERTQFSFVLNTAKNGEDGFDFDLSEGATSIKFTVKIDGRDVTDLILIGSKSDHPAKPTFTLPAHPMAEKKKSKQ
jgi:hypothetical protein